MGELNLEKLSLTPFEQIQEKRRGVDKGIHDAVNRIINSDRTPEERKKCLVLLNEQLEGVMKKLEEVGI